MAGPGVGKISTRTAEDETHWRAQVGPSSQHVGGSVRVRLHHIAPRKQEKTVNQTLIK